MRALRRPPPNEVGPKDSPADYTAVTAPERVLHINLPFLKYGTADRIQGAAIVILMTMLPILLLVVFLGMWPSFSPWAEKVFGWLGPVIVLVSGVAMGRSSPRD
jgi:hypothetical protein